MKWNFAGAESRKSSRRAGNKVTSIAFFGHFASTNLGNEATLQAILHQLCCFRPHAEFICISTNPDAAIATHQINAIPISETFIKYRPSQNAFIRLIQKGCIAIPSEAYRWVKGFASLRRTDMLIIPGTGLLSDAWGLRSFGPYNLFKWSLIAKSCGCKLLFISVGAGPLYSALGRWFVKSALSLADFRSYRDSSTQQYLTRIGFRADKDHVYPDLAFSLPETLTLKQSLRTSGATVVGVGVMRDTGRYGGTTLEIHARYLMIMAQLVRWLLGNGYNVRLLIGDIIDDMDTMQEFRGLLKEELSSSERERIIEEPVGSVGDLLAQIASTDFVVATRFHNVLLSLLCNKPVISISFHQKCESLMEAMGLSTYCLSMNDLTIEPLIQRFCELARNAPALKSLIEDRVVEFRDALNEQYDLIAGYLSESELASTPTQQ
jgi:polysaccharide pyruvyl transferase WcaK-like protein